MPENTDEITPNTDSFDAVNVAHKCYFSEIVLKASLKTRSFRRVFRTQSDV